MAFITSEIKLPHANRTVQTEMYFPTDLPESVGNKVRGVITLLHGQSNTGSDWMRFTSAPRYAADNGYILVAPNADNSFYLDMAYGDPFHTILTELLPAQLQAIFKLPAEREKNFIAGFSMGGYGALRFALTYPDRYAACASFSGPLDARQMLAIPQVNDKAFLNYAISLLGPQRTLPDDADLFYLASQVASLPKPQQPRIFCSCGNQDGAFVDIAALNEAFVHHTAGLGLNPTYKKWDGGHDFAFWDRSLAEFIAFIQNSDYGERKSRNGSSPITDVSP